MEDWDVDVAGLVHGRDGWAVMVRRHRLWRMLASRTLSEVTHRLGLCCGEHWVQYAPDRVTMWLHDLDNWIARLDGGECLYEFEVDDAFAAAHASAEFYEMVKRWEADDAQEEEETTP